VRLLSLQYPGRTIILAPLQDSAFSFGQTLQLFTSVPFALGGFKEYLPAGKKKTSKVT